MIFHWIIHLVIAGPCSAETEEQVLKTAYELKQSLMFWFTVREFGNLAHVHKGFEGGEIGWNGCKKPKQKPVC